VDKLWLDRSGWLRSSILNTAGSGYFSSDRAIMDYARNVWGIRPMDMEK